LCGRQSLQFTPAIERWSAGSDKERPGKVRLDNDRLQILRLALKAFVKSADGSHDAETLLVHQAIGNLYVITKVPFQNPVVYEATGPLVPRYRDHDEACWSSARADYL